MQGWTGNAIQWETLSAYYSALPICFETSFGNYSDLIKKVLHFGYENYNTNKIFRYGRLEKNEFG